MSIKVTLPDGSVKEVEQGASSMDIAMGISEGLARNVVAAEVNGEVWDATRPFDGDASLKLLQFKDDAGRDTFWHSSAHLMAEAIEALYPGVKFWVGPAVEGGFYYDVDFGDHNLTEEELAKIELKMKELAKLKNPF